MLPLEKIYADSRSLSPGSHCVCRDATLITDNGQDMAGVAVLSAPQWSKERGVRRRDGHKEDGVMEEWKGSTLRCQQTLTLHKREEANQAMHSQHTPLPLQITRGIPISI